MAKIMIVMLVIYILGLGGYIVYDKVLIKENNSIKVDSTDDKTIDSAVVKSNDFNYNLILHNHELAEKNKNYLISPYSIEIALNMLRDGATGDTKEEIDKVIGTRKINDVTIKDRVSVANAIFIKNKYENNVLSTYKDNLKTKYNAEMVIDEFITPDKINNWVNDKTSGMIEKILDNIDDSFALGLANALAIDVEWVSEFECQNTISEEFTKADGSKINVEMMHKNGYKYIKENDVEGIVLPYKKVDGSNVELEFIGLIPTGDLDSYINNNLKRDLNNINNLIKTPIKNETKEQIVKLLLPRFTYDSGINKFDKLLDNMGIKKVFTSDADFSNMINVPVYVSEAIHKTHIELMEKGTKAAAVTYFGIKTTGIPPKKVYEKIDIKFNKPFIYIIREKNTNEMLFFGVINEPNLWKGTTCSKSD